MEGGGAGEETNCTYELPNFFRAGFTSKCTIADKQISKIIDD
jgi:hypothetical protein